MAGVSGGASKSRSDTASNQGFDAQYKSAFQPTVFQTAEQANSMAREYAQSPVGYFQGQSTRNILDVDPNTGLPRASTQFLGSLANQEMAKFSAGGSHRGQWSPDNAPSIVQGALMGVADKVLPMQADYSKFMAGLPDQLMNSRLGFLNSVNAGNSSLIGGSSTGSSSASSWNAGAQVCWIAGVLYGEGSHEQQMIRQWLLSQTTRGWKALTGLYLRYGQQVARGLERHPWAQRFVRPLFNYMLRQAHGR